MDWTQESKDTEERDRLKNKNQLYVAFRRPISTTKTQSEGMENDTPQENGIHRKMGVVISDKMDFKIKKVPRNQDEHFIMMNRTMHQEDITLTNTYAPNVTAPKYIKQWLTDLKEETDKNTII